MGVFTKPYPKDSDIKKKLFTSLIFGNFVFLFLFLFQPFGINEWQVSYKALRLLGYGAITGVVLLINSLLLENVFQKWFLEKNWKVWKEIAWGLWNILIIGTFNLLYSHWQMQFPLSFIHFLTYQWITLLVGFFPVTIVTLFSYNRLLNKNLQQAKQITQVIESEPTVISQQSASQTVHLVGENSKESVEIVSADLLYIEAADNYIEVVWLNNGTFEKKLLRNTLKNIEGTIAKTDSFFRCHRSYIVNLNKVIRVSGNSQGYKLHFATCDFQVPVSRSLNETVRLKIEAIHSKGGL